MNEKRNILSTAEVWVGSENDDDGVANEWTLSRLPRRLRSDLILQTGSTGWGIDGVAALRCTSLHQQNTVWRLGT